VFLPCSVALAVDVEGSVLSSEGSNAWEGLSSPSDIVLRVRGTESTSFRYRIGVDGIVNEEIAGDKLSAERGGG